MIFEDLDPLWFRSMWETRGSARADMIEILISLALLKLKSRLWYVDLLWTMLTFVYFGLYLFPTDGLMTSTFGDYLWYYGDVVLYLWYCGVIFQLLSLSPIVLVKSSATVFSLRRKRWFSEGCVLEGHWWVPNIAYLGPLTCIFQILSFFIF